MGPVLRASSVSLTAQGATSRRMPQRRRRSLDVVGPLGPAAAGVGPTTKVLTLRRTKHVPLIHPPAAMRRDGGGQSGLSHPAGDLCAVRPEHLGRNGFDVARDSCRRPANRSNGGWISCMSSGTGKLVCHKQSRRHSPVEITTTRDQISCHTHINIAHGPCAPIPLHGSLSQPASQPASWQPSPS